MLPCGALENGFDSGRDDFNASCVLQAKKPAPPANQIPRNDFDPSAQYCSPDYEEVEFDCLLKLTLPTSYPYKWTREPAQPWYPIFVDTCVKQALPLRSSPPFSPPPYPLSGTRSYFSMDFCPSKSTMYVVGETYHAALGDGTNKHLTQKLLQAEQSLQFLCAKEGKLGAVDECILGMVFIGTATDAQCEKIYQSLRHYHAILPCLWTLQGLGRLLCYQVRAYEPAVENMRIQDALANLKEEFANFRVENTRIRDALANLKEESANALANLKEESANFREEVKVGQELILEALKRDREERERARACCALQ